MIYHSRGYKVKSVERKGTWGNVWRKSGTSFQESSPSGITQDTLNFLSNELWQHMWNVVYQKENSLETHCPGFLLGVGYIGTFCLACTTIPGSQKEKGVNINHIVCTKVQWATFTKELWGLSQSTSFSDTSPGPPP